MSAVVTLPTRRVGRRLFLAVTVALTIIVGLALLNLVRGAPNVDLPEVWRAITAPTTTAGNQAHFLIRELRIPRILLGLLCGAALGMVGVLLQDSLRNPMADPGLLGIAQGAALVMAIFTIYPEVLPNVPRPLLCLVAGSLAGFAVVIFSGTIRNPVRMILAGSVLSAFFATLTTVIILLAPFGRAGGLGGYYRYVTGSVSAADWSILGMVAPWLAIGIPTALLAGRSLNLLQLGDDMATSAGLNPFRARLLLIFVAMILVAPVIAATGPVAFIALFAPHIARWTLTSTNSQYVLFLSAIYGALLLLAADTVGRLLFFPTELPAGIWTVAMVGPAAIFLVAQAARRARL